MIIDALKRVRLSVSEALCVCILSLLTVWMPSVNASEPLESRLAFWRAQAFKCRVPGSEITFPSRPTGSESQPCDDGDMTLFNGLLCAAGEEDGCKAVADA